MRRLILNAVAVGLTAIILISCGKIGNDPREPIDLRVMSFNIEWGGTHISFDNIVKAIRLAEADIVGIQEAEGNLQRLAVALGWHYDLRNYVISRYPLIDPPGADGRYIYVEVKPGKVVAIANIHLPSDPYGPDAIRDGATTDAVLAIERTARLPMIQPYLEVLPSLVERGIPVFMTGDFNAPAHTDWVEAMVGSRPFLNRAIDWPVSRAVTVAGFKDSWRVIYPDPVTDPGLTWWAGRPPLERYSPGENDVQDRIDFIWYAGPTTVHSSEIVGEANRADVSISVMPWPSDHRAIVSQFKVMSAVMPPLINTAHRVYRTGENIEVYARAHAHSDLPVIVSLSRVDDAAQVIEMQPADGNGHLTFSSELFTSGEYKIVMETDGNDAVLSCRFWVLDAGAVPTVEVIGLAFDQNDPIEIRWRNSPGNRNDYVMVSRLEKAAAEGGGNVWAYTKAQPNGRLYFNQATVENDWPLEPGSYRIRLMKDDGNNQLAVSQEFIIR